MIRKNGKIQGIILIFSILIGLFSGPVNSVKAAAELTVTPITWNVIGLDSNNVTVGPNNFPIGVRVCNTGDAAATNVSADFVWDSADAYISLRTGSLDPITVSSIAPGLANCVDFYFEVEVTRNSNAYDHTREYHIEVSSNETATISTSTPREIYVEHLISQSRNSTTDVLLDTVSVAPGGIMTLMLGETYDIELIGSTATNGYEQIESYINFPNTIFQVNSVTSTYTANGGTDPDALTKVYADGCNWENDPNSPNYRACLSTGKYGGSITVNYNVTIIGGAGQSKSLNTLIYDFSGSSYHYNNDFSVAGRIATIVDPSSVSIAKSFIPDPTSVNGISTLNFTISNPNNAELDDLNFTDTFPIAPGAMVTASPATYSSNSCGTPTIEAPIGSGSFNAGAASVAISNATVPANGSCTIIVNVTAPTASPPDYSNNTSNLFIGSTDTGNNASDTLTVTTAPLPPPCTPGLELATWIMDPTQGAGVPPAYWFLSSTVSDPPTTARFVGSALPGVQIIDTATGNPVNSWSGTGWITGTSPVTLGPGPNTPSYFEFELDTSHYFGNPVGISIDVNPTPIGNWAQPSNITVNVHSSADGAAFVTFINANPITRSVWTTLTGTTTPGSTTTRFRVNISGRSNGQPTATFLIDNIIFTGCGVPQPPGIAKTFSPDPIAVNGISTLTFTLTNENNVGLTGVAFSDSLPAGVQVAATPNAFTTCGGTPVWTPAAGSTVLNFSGASIPVRVGAVNGTCTAQVDVTATTAGPHTNVSGYISSTETGTNYGPDGSATDTLTAIAPPEISKQFSPNPILTNGTSALTFTIANPNPNDQLTNVNFTDSYPAGVVNTTPVNTSTSCTGGTVTALAGLGSVSLAGATIPGGGSCTVQTDVTSAVQGSYVNTSGAVDADIVVGTDTATDTLVVKTPQASIALLKQVSSTATGPWLSTLATPIGGPVYYKFYVENTGDVLLNPFSVTDPDPVVGPLLAGCTWYHDTYGPPPAYAYLGTAAITPPLQLPVAGPGVDPSAFCIVGPIGGGAVSGSHSNTATASSGAATPVSSTATYATTGLTIDKSVAETYFTTAGDTLNYSFVVTNTGYASLIGPVTVNDDQATDEACPAVSTAVQTAPPGAGDGDNWLDPGEAITCTASYTIIAADVTAGSVTNVASATVDGVTSPTDTETVNLAALTIDKDTSTATVYPNDTISYTIVVENTGGVDLTNFQVTDTLPFTSGEFSVTSVTAPGYTVNGGYDGDAAGDINLLDGSDTLAAAATATITIDIQLISAATGTYDNTAEVNTTETGAIDDDGLVADDPGTPGSGADPENDEDVTVVAYATIGDYVWADVNGDGLQAGESGIDGVTVDLYRDNNGDGLLDGGDTLLSTATTAGGGAYDFTLLAADDYIVDVTDTGGVLAGYTLTTANDPLAVSLAESQDYNDADFGYDQLVFAVSLTKTGTLNDDVPPIPGVNAGDSIGYSFVVTNIGSIALTNVSVTDPLPGLSAIICPSGNPIPSLAVAVSETCTASYNITQVDIDAGSRDNTATVTSIEGASDTDSESIPLAQNPGIGLTKNSPTATVTAVGQVVPYQYIITNTGNVTLTNVTLTDNNTDNPPVCVGGLPATIAVGASVNCTAQHTVTLAEYNAGGDLSNTATTDSDQTGPVQVTLDIPIIRLFDPPFGIKDYDASGIPILRWTMVWINDSADPAMEAEVYDPIPTGTTYSAAGLPSGYPVPGGAPAGSTNIGVSCVPDPTSVNTFTTECYYEGPTLGFLLGRIVWRGTLGPDAGATDQAIADDEIVITFGVTVADGIRSVENNATIDADITGDDVIDPIDNELAVASAQAIWTADPPDLPETGFAPGVVTNIPEQPSELMYQVIDNTWLEIPALNIKTSIVGIPVVGDDWDITWLSNQAGWLHGSAYPSYSGNSVLTGHVYLPSGLPGPFIDLNELRWDDEIIIHAYGQQYVYQVRSNQIILPDDSGTIKHEEYPWLTLVTCKGYNEITDSYNYRVRVRAILIGVKSDRFH